MPETLFLCANRIKKVISGYRDRQHPGLAVEVRDPAKLAKEGGRYYGVQVSVAYFRKVGREWSQQPLPRVVANAIHVLAGEHNKNKIADTDIQLRVDSREGMIYDHSTTFISRDREVIERISRLFKQTARR